jgi:hypothetical protein
MQVKNGPGACYPSRGERTPSEQRMEVVGVDHVGFQLPDGVNNLLGIEPARHQTPRSRHRADGLARALEQLDVVAATCKQVSDVCDCALLATLEAVAVM